MYYNETPTEDGWYWVDFGDGLHYVGYLQEELTRLDLFVPDINMDFDVVSIQRIDEGHWEPLEKFYRPPWRGPLRGPSSWIGPLRSPFGDFSSDIAEFSDETYREANASGLTPVMLHLYGPGNRTETRVTLLSKIDADALARRAFEVEEGTGLAAR